MAPLTDSDLEGGSWPFSQSLHLHVFCLFVCFQTEVLFCSGFPWLPLVVFSPEPHPACLP